MLTPFDFILSMQWLKDVQRDITFWKGDGCFMDWAKPKDAPHHVVPFMLDYIDVLGMFLSPVVTPAPTPRCSVLWVDTKQSWTSVWSFKEI